MGSEVDSKSNLHSNYHFFFFFLVKVYLGSMYCGFLVPLDASHNTVYCVHKYEYILCIKVKVYNLKIILSI